MISWDEDVAEERDRHCSFMGTRLRHCGGTEPDLFKASEADPQFLGSDIDAVSSVAHIRIDLMITHKRPFM
jgi:hypothetical protein